MIIALSHNYHYIIYHHINCPRVFSLKTSKWVCSGYIRIQAIELFWPAMKSRCTNPLNFATKLLQQMIDGSSTLLLQLDWLPKICLKLRTLTNCGNLTTCTLALWLVKFWLAVSFASNITYIPQYLICTLYWLLYCNFVSEDMLHRRGTYTC